jgi:hypothetical protein
MRVSDLSEALIRNEEDVIQIEVTHPDFTQAITLDAVIDDLEGNLPQPQEYVSLKVADQQYLMTVAEFNSLFTGVQDAEDVLERAYREQEEERQRQEETPRRGRGRRRQQAGERSRKRVDWSSPERAGLDHPGRISQAERDYVREHLDEVNARRREAGQAELEANDPETAGRYGLSS